MLASAYSVASPEIIFERFDGDLVVLDLATGRYFSFNTTAAALWSGLMSGVPADALVAAGAAAHMVEALLARLSELELVVPVARADGAMLDAETAAVLATLTEAPAVELFDDLADLITADPIHDTDAEAGWPHMRAAAT